MEIEYRYEHLPELKELPLRQHIAVLSGAGMSERVDCLLFATKMVCGSNTIGKDLQALQDSTKTLNLC